MLPQWKNGWSIKSLLFIMIFAVALVGCASDQQEADTTVQTEENQEEVSNTEDITHEQEEEQHENEAYPLTLTDGVGNEVVIEEEPETIASVIPSNTEIVFALGLGDRVIGVSTWCNYPAEVADIDKIGDMDMDVEAILEKAPDLLLVSQTHHNNNAETLEQFRSAGIDVIVVQDASSFEDAYTSIQLIAQAAGATEQGEEIVANIKERLNHFKEKAQQIEQQKRVWVEVSPAPDIFTTGQGTFVHEMLESINATNVAGDQEGWLSFTEEEIVQLEPDVIVTTYGYYVEEPAEQVKSRDGWAEVPAVKSEQIFDVHNDTVTRPGPRLIDGVETLAKLIYPDIFDQ